MGDVTTAGLAEVTDMAAGGFQSVGKITGTLTDVAGSTVWAAVVGVFEIGGDLVAGTCKAARGVVKGTSAVGGDFGSAAVAAVEGAINAAGPIGEDTG